jgi:5-histidylcysteine sulfoxide synthase
MLRDELRTYFHATFDRYEGLFKVLKGDGAFYRKPISLRHPLIFYFGHTATFFINKLILAGLVENRINPRFESIFSVGVDEMSWDDLDDAHYDWPTVGEVKHYRDQVREVVDTVIRKAPLKVPVDWNNPWWAIPMGIEHERIHLETSSVLIRQHELKRVQASEDWRPCQHSGTAPVNAWVDIPSGLVQMGKSKAFPYYGWDNEFGAHTADVAAFQAARYLVSNGEFFEFVEAGGYSNDEYWEEEGRGWKNFAAARHPTFWVSPAGGWKLRTMLEEIPMPWDWPVEVNYHEAQAFCNWKKMLTGLSVRLPTEDQWQRLYAQTGLAEVIENTVAPANIHLDHYASPCPVNQFQHGELYDGVGNVWQWTETPIYPFDGFMVHPIYDDFTTPTYDNRHNIIKGGSWISCGNEALSSSRYAFRRHFFQHAGFRYVISNEGKIA